MTDSARDAQVYWTTIDGARLLLDESRNTLVSLLDGIRKAAEEAASELSSPTPPQSFSGETGFGGDRHPGLRACMLAIASCDALDAVSDSYGNVWTARNPLHGRALELDKALKEFQAVAQRTDDPDQAFLVAPQAAEAVRKAFSRRLPGLLTAGDRVAWREAGKAFEGRIVAIDQGVAMVGGISEITSYGSAGLSGHRLVPIAELRISS